MLLESADQDTRQAGIAKLLGKRTRCKRQACIANHCLRKQKWDSQIRLANISLDNFGQPLKTAFEQNRLNDLQVEKRQKNRLGKHVASASVRTLYPEIGGYKLALRG